MFSFKYARKMTRKVRINKITALISRITVSYFVLQVRDNKRRHSREQQLKWTQSYNSSWSRRNQGTAAKVDAVREQQFMQMQSGHSSVWTRETSALQRHYHTRLLVHQSRGLCQTDMVKEVRPRKHTHVCSEERTVMGSAVLTQSEVRAPPTSETWRAAGVGLLMKGYLESVDCLELVDWTTGLPRRWNVCMMWELRTVDSVWV